MIRYGERRIHVTVAVCILVMFPVQLLIAQIATLNTSATSVYFDFRSRHKKAVHCRHDRYIMNTYAWIYINYFKLIVLITKMKINMIRILIFIFCMFFFQQNFVIVVNVHITKPWQTYIPSLICTASILNSNLSCQQFNESVTKHQNITYRYGGIFP